MSLHIDLEPPKRILVVEDEAAIAFDLEATCDFRCKGDDDPGCCNADASFRRR